ncbi:MAG: hypothetical protein MAG794_00214 [Gammaproteobacteria bacterium]|nr:hypothetical protein [Gammaproteobacteria bacterium]
MEHRATLFIDADRAAGAGDTAVLARRGNPQVGDETSAFDAKITQGVEPIAAGYGNTQQM